MSTPGFTLVDNKRKPSESPPSERNTKKMTFTIPTKNRYEELEDTTTDEEYEEDEMENEDDAEVTMVPRTTPDAKDSAESRSPRDTRQKNNKKPPPPIVLHGNPSSNAHFKTFIEEQANTKNYEIRKGQYRTTLYLHDETSYKKIITALQNENMEFHTYTSKKEKNHSFVLCGLTDDTTPEEIKKDLDAFPNVQVKNIFKMKNTATPKFLVITGNETTMKTLTNLRVISNIRVKWQKYFNNKIFTQCHRCQEWGHATTNCNGKTKCLKCSENHDTRNCTLDTKSTPTCANCQGAHTANSTKCRIYQQLLENYERRKNAETRTANQTTVNAQTQPIPNINSQREFRPLRTPKTTSDNGQRTCSTKSEHTSKTTKAASTISAITTSAWNRKENQPPRDQQDTTIQDSFREMHKEMAKLDELINVREFTRSLRNLNNRLSKCNTKSEKFLTMQHFFAELNNDDD